MTSSKASRTEKDVSVTLLPRYQVCGGWKADWTQTYNMPTKYHLSTKIDDPDTYHFNFTYLHDYDVLLAENYTLELTLPYGAHEIEAHVPFDVEQSIKTSYGTLDFFGKPKLVMKRHNVHYSLHNKRFAVTYKFDSRYMFFKPIIMSLLVFSMFLFVIILARA